jgi:LuxR family maltose regulon positive regulatory protein
MSASLLTTKFYIPPLRPGLVQRPRLIEKLNAGLHRRLTLVSAPAGFGKTTLIASWIEGRAAHGQPPVREEQDPPQRAAWLSLDEGTTILPASYATSSLHCSRSMRRLGWGSKVSQYRHSYH